MTETLQTPIHELTTGSTFAGRYQVIEELGHGGMGRVYKVFDTDIKEKIALKLLRPEIALDKETVERFSNELKLARRISQRNVCRMFDLGKAEGTTFITMEFVPGEDLKKLIRKMGQVGAGWAVSIAKQVCEGLAEAHHIGVVHRDLKPQNIMVDEDGNARIMDFGIARSLRGKGITGAGVMIGTPEYMSPEQVEGKEVDQRSDIYSLGIILFEMVTGRVPFEGDTPFTIGVKHKSERPRNPRELNTQIPENLSRLILKCLEKDKGKRYQTAEELGTDLEKVEQGLPTTDRIIPKKKGVTLKEITVKFNVRRVLVAALGVFVLAVAAILTGVFLWHPGKTKPSPTGTAAVAAPRLVALPCKVLGSPESAYLTDAIPSTISTLLGEVQGMDTKVPPTSLEVEKVQGDLDKIAAAYGVETFVLSTATAEGDHLIFNIQLADARTRKVRWSHQYQGSRENYSDMAHEAAQGICKAVLPDAAPAVPTSAPTSNSESKLAFQQGQYYRRRYTGHGARADFERALGAFKHALELNPKDAETAGWISSLYLAAHWRGDIPEAQGLAEAEVWAQKALALDPRCSVAWVTRTNLEGLKPDADMGKQIEMSIKAAQLGPRSSHAQNCLAISGLATGGSLSLSIEAHREAVRLDPLVLGLYDNLAEFLTRFGLPGEALSALDTQLSLDPGNHWALETKVYVLVEMGRTEEAAALLKQLGARATPASTAGQRIQDFKWVLSLAADDDKDARSSLKAIMARFADRTAVWNDLQDEIHRLLPAVSRRFGKDAALDLLILSTKRGATMPYDVLMLRPDLKELRESPRAADVIKKTKVSFDTLMHILQDARARGELPSYLEAPLADLLKKLQIKL